MAGWVRDLDEPGHRLAVDVTLPAQPGLEHAACEILATVPADRVSQVLIEVGVGDGGYAFHAEFPRSLTPAECARIEVRPVGVASALARAPDLKTEYVRWGADPSRFQGYVDARSRHHVAGWARCLDDAEAKVELELLLDAPGGARVLQRLRADRFSATLVQVGVGDGVHAFQARLDPPLDEADVAHMEVRIVATGTTLQHAPEISSEWHPIAHLAMDIVNNCNLRCPFCVVDYSATKTTRLMADATFQSALRLIPYVTDGNFWLSCLHEATLHPRLLAFIEAVPRQYRHKLYYTTNLAKRMPDTYFAAICDAGLHHLNISLESRDPAIYEKMRAGARFAIFQDNWNRLLSHHGVAPAAPRLRYNIMCYRSNLREIPMLVQALLDEKAAWQVELRHTYDVAHIAKEFRTEQFLSTEEWAWLQSELAHHDPSRVVLLLPPGGQGFDPARARPAADPENDDPKFTAHLNTGEAAWNRAPQPFNLSMDWTGLLRVYGWKPQGPGQPDRFVTYAKTNIHFLADPLAFLAAL